jgi:hypothetical protein
VTSLFAARPRTWLSLRWPRQVEATQIRAGLAALHGLSTPGTSDPPVLRVVGRRDGLSHFLGVPTPAVQAIVAQLRQAVHGCSVVQVEAASSSAFTAAARLSSSSTSRVLNTSEPERAAACLLRSLIPESSRERVLLQVVLGPVRRPLVTPAAIAPVPTLRSFLSGAAPAAAPDARRAYGDKHGEAGWRAVVYVAAEAETTSRGRFLVGRVGAALRTLEAPGVRLRLHTVPPEQAETARPWLFNLTLNLSEAVVISGWPSGPLPSLPVDRLRTRTVQPARIIPSRGRIVAVSSAPGRERPLALSEADSTRHLHLLGPTGTGKSTTMLNLIVQDMDAGRGLVLVDPKGDLVEDVLRRVPSHRSDVVVLDPTDSDRPVGLNPLAGSERSGELVADQLLSVFKRLYAGSWGPRLQEILHAGLLTIAVRPDLTLCHLPLLYVDAGLRRRLVAPVADDPALGPFWAWFESMSGAERATVLAPVMNKLRSVVLRPSLRGVLGQTRPRFDLNAALRSRAVVLVNLAKGSLGPEAAQLFGGLFVSQLWQALQGRQALPTERRGLVCLHLDEFQDYLALPTDFAEVLTQARSAGASITLAHQHLHQLPPELRSAVLANARSKVVFQTSHEDAAVLARSRQEIEPEDLTELAAFEAYASLMAEGALMPFASVRTVPAPPVSSDPAAIRAASRARYGVDRSSVEAELRSFSEGNAVPAAPIGQRRRRPGAGQEAL